MRILLGLFAKSYLAALVASICAATAPSPALSQGQTGPSQPPVIDIGHAAISGFPGVSLAGDGVAPGVAPIDKTIIDLNGPSITVFDMRTMRGPLNGGPIEAPVLLEVPARVVGQVFGLAFDDGVGGGPPNLYAAASSAYGLQIVAGSAAADGTPVRLKAGAPGARFMAGQFGGATANPGAIWKIDGTTGAVSLFADTSVWNVPNSGPGLGSLAYDHRSRSLYVSDLDTGHIHRFAVDDPPARFPPFDHGIIGLSNNKLPGLADDTQRMDISSPKFRVDAPATWGMTQPERRVHGLAVHGARLYYAIASGPDVWSIALNPDGSFDSDEVRFEFRVAAAPSQFIASMVFDGQGRVTLGLRGAPTGGYDYVRLTEGAGGQVLRYARRQDGSWNAEPDSYAIGSAGEGSNASGGVGLLYGLGAVGGMDVSRCDGMLVATGDALSASGDARGLQINPAQLVRPSNAAQQGGIVSLRGSTLPEARGHVGGVAAFQRCGGESLPIVADTAPPAGVDTMPPPIAGPGGFPPPIGAPADFPPVIVIDRDPGTGAPPPAGGLDLTKKAIGKDCKPVTGKGCDFEITITNKGPGPFNGPVTFTERVTGDGAPSPTGMGIITNGPTPPWTCTKVGGEFQCSHANLSLVPGGSTKILIGMNLGAGSQSIKIFRNCAQLAGAAKPACAEIDTGNPGQTPPPPPPTDANVANLVLEKKATVASCGATGGGCDFEITVTNKGAQPFKGPIIIEEVARTLGPNGAVLGAGNLNGSSAPWVCSPDGLLGLKCVTPASTTLAPGGQMTLKVSFIPENGGTAGARLQNCARITGQANEVCASIPLSQQSGAKLRVEKSIIGGDCTTACAFTIAVHNVGNDTFNGGLVVTDIIRDDGGTAVDAKIIEVSDGWQCKQGTPVHVCRPPTAVSVVKPRERITFGILLNINRVRLDAFNCADVSTPQLDMLDKDQPDSCVKFTISPPPIVKIDPPPAPNLSVELKATSRDCPISGPCQFLGFVRNRGKADYLGKLITLNTVLPQRPAGMTAEHVGSPWTCTPGGDPPAFLRCESRHLRLMPDQFITFIATVRPGREWTKGNILTDCLKLSYDPAGNDKGLIKTDDEACADIIVDPYAVKLEKSGNQSCSPGEECRFDLTIFNPDQILHDAPVTITDGAKGMPTMPIISISEPLPCATQPTQIPFTCSSAGNVQFPVGYRKVHTITVRLPQGPAGAEFTNCASISPSDPTRRQRPSPGAPAAQVDPRESSACHTVRVAPIMAEPVSQPSCQGGMELSMNGRCACPPGTEWSGRACIAPSSTEVRACPAGTIGIYPNCRIPTSGTGGSDAIQQCPPETRLINGVCRRPEQQADRRPECPASRPIGSPPNCCPVGMVYEPRRGACRRDHVRDRCPPTMIGSPPNCRCPAGTILFEGRGCQRPSPVQPPPPPVKQLTCPSGMTGTPPNCQCPAGMRYVRGIGGSPPRCIPAQSPPPKRPPPQKDPAKDPGPIIRKCPSYQIGTFPNCRCPPRTTGPRCDQPIVR